MTHYRMLDRHPSVMITSNRNELKVYEDNKVFLNNGDNFELRFFNPLQCKIGVEIIFNGVKRSDGLLVINPGQDLILNRFLDENRKMVFETYNINENDPVAVKAIEKNGLITFKFYEESNNYNYNFNTSYNNIDINYDFPPTPMKPVYQKLNEKKHWKSSSTLDNFDIDGLTGTAGPSTVTATNIYTNSPVFTSLSNTTGVQSSISSNTTNLSSTYTLTSSMYSLETGRVEKGDYSNQQLTQINDTFKSSPFHTVSYQILPISTMNKNIKSVREYCTNCGYRIRKETWKYCPKCGSSL